ncbi:MAG: hypothetical protein J6A01_08715 [Proteobacteria bacterium]|nr:hypothetical protein [Pseudomonadota bacterium]
MKHSIPFIILFTFLALCFLPMSSASALEGDWELGAAPTAFFMPAHNIYGGGAEFFGRYSVLDGLSVGLAAGIYGARNNDLNQALGIYQLRAGMFYSLDVLQWVPVIGLNVSSIFSEDQTYLWHRNAHGLSVDFDFQLLYRGIRHLGIGIFFNYHIVLVDEDYMTAGLTVSWFSGMF